MKTSYRTMTMTLMLLRLWLVLLAVAHPRASAFLCVAPSSPRASPPSPLSPLRGNADGGRSGDAVASVDVSDLGLTVADLEEKIPLRDFAFESSGYQSTSRIPEVDDGGCQWAEKAEDVDVTLRIPGLRGQPAEALSVLFSSTTVSVTAFGRVVWSAVQMGTSDADDCTFLTEEGMDGVPIIQLSVRKRDLGERWGGFILQIGEDSIL
ncbi:hypothetical protein ACHAWF_003804 [Thalassiosira exigua]